MGQFPGGHFWWFQHFLRRKMLQKKEDDIPMPDPWLNEVIYLPGTPNNQFLLVVSVG